jgi:putative endonuclease
MGWQVYIVECKDGTLYTGIARSLDLRITQHNEGKGAKYTRSRRPVKLRYSEQALDRSTAQSRERALKQLSRKAKLALISSAINTP